MIIGKFVKSIENIFRTSVLAPMMTSAIINDDMMVRRKIPSSGELLPVVGLGTWLQFDVGNSENELGPLKTVLNEMLKMGGSLIDSSPMYGKSEKVIGDITAELNITDKFFFATKVWTRGRQEGISQMKSSMKKMRRKSIDLMQVHNLVDWKIHLETLNEWKKDGKIRYTGITHYTEDAHTLLEKIITSNKVDFVQFNYSIKTRNAEKSLLNTAMDNGVAVIVNEPFDKGTLFEKVKGKSIPEWIKEYDIGSWSQFFLKYILSNPAVTCVIPGTSNPMHIIDNMNSGFGKFPDEKDRKKMIQILENL